MQASYRKVASLLFHSILYVTLKWLGGVEVRALDL